VRAADLAEALDGKREGAQWRCICPVHNGRALTVGDGQNGGVVVHCKAGCEQGAVIDALKEHGLWHTNDNGAKPVVDRRASGAPEAEYLYIHPDDGNAIAIKKRFCSPNGQKTFQWWRPGADKPGLNGLKESQLPLYNAHLLPTEDSFVFVTEGEKAADACLDVGLLAVCAAGGAATKDFGDALKRLAGSDVVLWPDADGDGRALMHRVARALEGVAASVHWFTPDLPHKADAWDYFHDGGTRDAILEGLERQNTEPVVEQTAAGYVVTLPDGGGLVRFRFDGLDPSRHAHEADLTVRVEIPGLSREPFSARLNLLSLSNRDAFRRQLEEMLPADKGVWAVRLNRAVALVRQAIQDRDPSVRLLLVPDTAAEPALHSPMLGAYPTMLFGKGGGGKTYLSLDLALAVALGVDFLGRTCSQADVLFVDYEADAGTLKSRLRALLRGRELEPEPASVPITYWPATGIPLADLVPALQRKVREANIGLLVVDSAALAAGAEPERAETAIRFFNALAQIGVPSLVIAHVTKGDEDQWPFGSIFYHNSARATWNVKLVQEQQDGVAHVGLFNRKSNNSRLEAPLGVRMEFTDTSVRIRREEVVHDFAGEISLPVRLRSALKDGQRSIKELADYLDANEETVGRTLRRMSGVLRLQRAPDSSFYWGLSA